MADLTERYGIIGGRLAARMLAKDLNPMREALLASQAQSTTLGQPPQVAAPPMMTAGPDASAIPGTEGVGAPMGAAPQLAQPALSPRQQMILSAAQDPRQFAMLAGGTEGAMALAEEMKPQPRSREIVVHPGDELNNRLGLGLKDAESAVVQLDYDSQDRQLPGFTIKNYKTTADNTEAATTSGRASYPSGTVGRVLLTNDIRTAHGLPMLTPEETEIIFREASMTSSRQQDYRRQMEQLTAAGVPEHDLPDFTDWTMTFGAGVGMSNAVGPEAVKRLSDYRTAADSGTKALRSIENAYQLVDVGLVAGAAAEQRLQLVKAVDTILGRETDAKSAATEAYLANSGALVGEAITAFGAGTGLSDADRDFARLITAGKIEMTPQALRMALEILARGKLGEIAKYNTMLDNLQGDAKYLNSYFQKVQPPESIYGRISPLATAPEGLSDDDKLKFYLNQRPSYLPQGANQQLPPTGGAGPRGPLTPPGPNASVEEITEYYRNLNR